MQMVGQPARDLCRHFSQRWNHLLRIKNHTTAMPFLVPPPDFSVKELTDRGLTGTCEVQVCRSCGPWSMGTANRIEHSIQNAYLKGESTRCLARCLGLRDATDPFISIFYTAIQMRLVTE